MKPKHLLTLALSLAAVSATTTFAAIPVGEAEYQFVLDPGQGVTSADWGGTLWLVSDTGDSPDGLSGIDLAKSTLTVIDQQNGTPITFSLSDVTSLEQNPGKVEDTIWNPTTISQMDLVGIPTVTLTETPLTEIIVTDSSIDDATGTDPTGKWVRVTGTAPDAGSTMTLMTLAAGSLAAFAARNRKK